MRAKFFSNPSRFAAISWRRSCSPLTQTHFFAGGNVTAQEKITQGTSVLDPGGTLRPFVRLNVLT